VLFDISFIVLLRWYYLTGNILLALVLHFQSAYQTIIEHYDCLRDLTNQKKHFFILIGHAASIFNV